MCHCQHVADPVPLIRVEGRHHGWLVVPPQEAVAVHTYSTFRIQGPSDHPRHPKPFLTQSPDLPLPHGLAPSETMVSDHGLGPPLSTENPRNKGFSGLGAPIFGFGLGDPATKG